MAPSLRSGMRIVIASHNKGKVREIAELVAPYGIEVVSAGELGLPEPDETETTFAGNARLKAVAAAKASGLTALADDSGLEIAALGGEPGIDSALWGGPKRDFGLAMQRVHEALAAKGVQSSPANFTCALALATPDGGSQAFEGKVFGQVIWPPRGTRGFGYDPMFVADGYAETFGEMEPEVKDAISHRARAFEQMMLAAYDDE